MKEDTFKKLKILAFEGNESNLPQILELILAYAYELQASDVHIEAQRIQGRVRFRVDGFLKTILCFKLSLMQAFISRLKVLASLDIAERRLPQDGRFQMGLNKQSLEYRLSICPQLDYEKAVIRLVNRNEKVLSLEELGLLPTQLKQLKNILYRPHGLVLVSGPTGSGKTLSQYAMLHFLNQEQRNLISIEDPVEMILPGVNQIHVNTKTGLEFQKILRAILRQDPDIIMIGEIRDLETAEVAVKAAQTGHLVLATVHANSAWDAFLRLKHLGIPDYAMSGVIRASIAQRLLRCICAVCKGKGCEACDEGYRGRTGIFELIDFPKKTDILKAPPYLSLRKAGLKKVAMGITRREEVQRVV